MRTGLTGVLCLGLLAGATTGAAQILPADRITVWNPGVPGGIPIRTARCAQLDAATYGNGAQEASAAIQAALDACPSNQVVLLSAGTFTVNNLLLIHSSITLRGAGAGTTILQKTNGARARLSPNHPIDPDSYPYDAQPIVIIGPARWVHPDDTTSQNLTTDGAKSATTVSIANAAGFAAGQFVLLDERSGASWQPTPAGFPSNALVWQGDRVAWNMHLPQQLWQDDSQFSDSGGPYDLNGGVRTLPNAMGWFARPDRPINEIKEIAAVSSNTLTFTTPLHISYRTSHAAQLTRYTGSNLHVRNAGVESLTTRGGADGQIRFENAAYSWAKNIEVTQWIGEGVAVDGSFRVEIRDSYVHDGSWPTPGGAGYALSFARASSEILVENNIFINACKEMVARSSGAGSVIAYNYADDAWDYDSPQWVEVGLNASHMAGPHHVLFEGNYSHNVDSDYTHGNAIDLTFFRNWLSGQRRNFADSSNARTVGLAYGSWWDSFVGNVLGRPGQTSGWVYEASPMAGTNANWGERAIWKLGDDPERWDMVADPQTLATVIRDGNWDSVTNSIRWHNTPGGFVIPDSLYLSGKPAFFGSNRWPWINPTNGETYTLPAKARYDAGKPNDTTVANPMRSRWPQILDLNHDRGGDLFLYNRATGERRFELTNVTGFSEIAKSWDPSWQVYPATLNADDDTDFFLYDPVRGLWIQALNHAGDGTFTYTFGNWDSSWTVVPADFDGDGLTDMFVYNVTSGVWLKCFADGGGNFKGYTAGNWDPGWTFYTGDLNGDGRDDFFLYNQVTGGWVEAFSQEGLGTFDYLASGQWSPGWQIIRADLNGDRRTDLFLLNAKGAHVSALSRAAGDFDYVDGPQWAPGWSVVPGDLNGDGATDLFLYNATSGIWAEAFSDRAGSFTYASGQWDPGWSVALSDFNADGRGDIILFRADGTWVQATYVDIGTFVYSTGNWGAGWTMYAQIAN